jgi:hypothetical protein
MNMSPEFMDFAMKYLLPQVIGAVGLYAGIRTDLKLLKFKVGYLWAKAHDTQLPPDTN